MRVAGRAMKTVAALLARVVGALLLWAAVGKIAGFEAFTRALSSDPVLPWHPGVAYAVPSVEAALAFALFSPAHRRLGAAMAAGLFLGFAVYHLAAILAGAGACACLAGLPGVGRPTMMAICLASAAACVVVARRKENPAPGSAERSRKGPSSPDLCNGD